jgi:hypothetical protein
MKWSTHARRIDPINRSAKPLPPHERLGTDDRESSIENRRKPTIRLDQEPAVVVREPNLAPYLTPENDQLMSENRILCLKSAVRLEWQGQNGQDEAEQPEHGPQTLGDPFG